MIQRVHNNKPGFTQQKKDEWKIVFTEKNSRDFCKNLFFEWEGALIRLV